MATSQSGSSKDRLQGKEVLETLKEAIKIQGDYRNILADSISELNKSLKSYDKIEAKLAGINRSSINIKEVQSKIAQASEEKYINDRKIADLNNRLKENDKKSAQDLLKSINEKTIAEQAYISATKLGNENLIRLSKESINKLEDRIDTQSQSLNLDQLAYAEALKTQEIQSKSNEVLENQLKTEKEIRKQVGFTGAAFTFLAEKLGVAESFQEDMVKSARDLNDEGKKFGFFDKIKLLGRAGAGAFKEMFKDPLAFAAGIKLIGAAFSAVEGNLTKIGAGFAKAGNLGKEFSEDSSNLVSGVTDPIAGLVENIPLVGGLMSGMIKGFASFLDLLVGTEDKIVKMGRSLNLSKEESMKLNKEFAQMSLHSGDIFMNSKKLMESQVELSDQLGINNILSEEQLETNNKLKEFAGIEADTRSKIAQSSIISGKSSEGIVKSVISQVNALKNATGISFNYQKILGEASRLGGALGLQFAKYPEKLAKSLIITKGLGLDLQKLDGMASSFLDFESSISNEFEAQLLTGKEINLQKAREAFLNNDLATAAGEITKQVGSSQDFLKMNRISAESMSKAFGMSRDEMADMLKQQEMLSKFGAKDTKDLQAKVVALKNQGKEKEAILKLGSEESYQNMINASTQEKMMGFIEKIKQSLVDFLTHSGIVEKIQGFITYLTEPKNVKAIISKVQGFLADAVQFIGTAASYILDGLDILAFGQIPNDFIDNIKSGAENMGAQIRSMGAGEKHESIGEAIVKSNTPTQSVSQPQKTGFGPAQTVVIQNHNQINVDERTIANGVYSQNVSDHSKLFSTKGKH